MIKILILISLVWLISAENTILLFGRQFCLPYLQLSQLMSKIRHKDIEYVESMDESVATQYGVKSFPTLIFKKQEQVQHYQYNLNEKQIKYWLNAFFFNTVPQTPQINQLLTDSKQPLCVILPNIQLPISQYVYHYPLFHFYQNSSTNSTLKIVNKIASTIQVRQADTRQALQEWLEDTLTTHYFVGDFSHRVRMHMIQHRYIGVCLFYQDNSIKERYWRVSQQTASKDGLQYDIMRNNPQNRYIFMTAQNNKKINKILMEYLDISQVPTVVAFSFHHTQTIKKAILPIDRYYAFGNSYLYWLSMRKYDGDTPKDSLYCPQMTIIHNMRSNSLQHIKKNVELVRYCKQNNIKLQTNSKRWHDKEGVFHCTNRGITPNQL